VAARPHWTCPEVQVDSEGEVVDQETTSAESTPTHSDNTSLVDMDGYVKGGEGGSVVVW